MTPAEERMNILKEQMAILGRTVTKAEFAEAFKTVMEVVLKSEIKLAEKVDKTLAKKLSVIDEEISTAKSEIGAEVANIRSAVRESKQDLRQIIQETREVNETTLSSLKRRGLEAMDALFTKMRLNEKFDEMHKKHQEMMHKMSEKMAEVPDKEGMRSEIMTEMVALIPPPQPPETATEVRDKLETLEGEDRLDAKYIKGLEDLEKRLNDRINSIPRNAAPRSSQSTMFHDMSSQTNGVTKVFTCPKNLAGVVVGSDFPNVLMEGNGFTMNASRTQITLTTDNAPSSGSQLVFIGRSIFNI